MVTSHDIRSRQRILSISHEPNHQFAHDSGWSINFDAPIPPFLNIPSASLFRVSITKREPEDMSLKGVGETGYVAFAAMSVSSQFADQEVERCVGLVRSLVGEVNLQCDNDSV